jgi:hypothetical protein
VTAIGIIVLLGAAIVVIEAWLLFARTPKR